jgi:uncharacterized protein (DUF849 family)
MHAPRTILTCAVTGNITQPGQTPHLPITPEQIADDCLAAAEAGAAAVHIHVRDPATGRPSMEVDLYADVVRRIRARNRELVINLTTGPGGRFVPSEDDPKVAGPGTTLCAPEVRVAHVAALKPDVCSLDLNTMNSGDQVVINTPANVRRMARVILEAGTKPELECFDSGDLVLAQTLVQEGTLPADCLYTLVTGVRYALPSTPEALLFARGLLPPGAAWSAFGIGRWAFPIVAQTWLLGGHVRIGLEDTIYLDKGVLAPGNAPLVARAREIVQHLGGVLATPAEARQIWRLREHN